MMAVSHYLPAFTVVRSDGTEQTVCGQFIEPREMSTTPTCPGCATWLTRLDLTQEPARVIGSITPAEPYGVNL